MPNDRKRIQEIEDTIQNLGDAYEEAFEKGEEGDDEAWFPFEQEKYDIIATTADLSIVRQQWENFESDYYFSAVLEREFTADEWTTILDAMDELDTDKNIEMWASMFVHTRLDSGKDIGHIPAEHHKRIKERFAANPVV